ncbi:MAG: hypothetical protein LBV32_02500 [Tannerellaceae bacterium]|nr:hypothetical protein [Tannerellaceae bacterium]
MKTKLFTAIMLVASMIIFSSCENDQMGDVVSLSGTVWEGINADNEVCTITFTSDKEGKLEIGEDAREITYTYKNLVIDISSLPVASEQEGWGYAVGYRGNVDGSKMTILDLAVFTRK